MNPSSIELALGTAQFGMKYGIVGRGEVVPINEVQQILAKAWELGLRTIDTAPVYGEIEAHLAPLLDDYAYRVVSKISALPESVDLKRVEHIVSESIQKTRDRLGDSLTTLLFHHADDLLGKSGDLIWKTATRLIEGSDIQLGVSCYSPEELLELRHRFNVNVAQLPGNALDQRLRTVNGLENIEIHLRSVFLQGALLREPNKVVQALPKQTLEALRLWQKWCANQCIPALQGALSMAKSLPGVRYCIVGVDNLAQLEEICEAWSYAEAITSYPPSINNPEIIDPRYWLKPNIKPEFCV
ncbi:MAG: aldo/keto reductase [Legionellaceae bacterium]|nr:aldo/keto reductase [Legionellaceae bacterium]